MTAQATRVVTVERGSDWEDGFARPRVVLTPYAAPSVLGLYGFAAATFMVALHLRTTLEQEVEALARLGEQADRLARTAVEEPVV
jgi:succinate-acetate transporter protein